MTLRVVEAGLCTLLVDQGRPGHRSLGVPLGGAADRGALALGNAIVGNPPGATALEISLAGPSLHALSETGCVVFGAPFDIHRNGRRLEAGRTFTLQPDDELVIGGTAVGMRAYLCVRHGFDVPTILGSRSALEPIKAETKLACPPSRIHARYRVGAASRMAPVRLDSSHLPLRVLPGLQGDWFEADDFYPQEFSITPASNRMGLRLLGKPLSSRIPTREMISEPVCPGAVQVTRDGQCIVLGVDGQTIGGYPKIAQVIQADLDKLGQARPGERVRFIEVELAEAAATFRRRQQEMDAEVHRLRISLAAFDGR